MAKNIYGGGARTNEFGLQFEQETSLYEALVNAGFIIHGSNVYFNNARIAVLAGKHDLYTILLEPNGIHYQNIISKKLLPDEAMYNLHTRTIYIIEKKFQSVAGSVDEKLQTCDFKKKQYQKLFSPLNVKVEYAYVCNDFFKKSQYKDTFDYISSVGCHYFYNEIPLDFLKLPPVG